MTLGRFYLMNRMVISMDNRRRFYIFRMFCLTFWMLLAFQGCSSQSRAIPPTADQLDPETLYQQGMNYGLARDGKERDDEKAFLLLRRAAQRGHLQATYALAWVYLDGRGTPPNPEQAARLFTEAAQKEHADSQYMLSVLYVQGRGLPKDSAASIHWLQKAAANGHKEAQNILDKLSFSPQSITPKQ